MAKTEKMVSIIADNVAHVRLLPDGKTADDVKADFFTERAKNELEAEQAAEKESPAAMKPQFQPETKAKVGAGDCPDCGKHYKRLNMHVCKSSPPPKPEEAA